MQLRFAALLALGFLLSACTTLTFNQSYQSASWRTIAIAPFSGDNAGNAEAVFVDAFATNHRIRFIAPEMVKSKIEQMSLTEQYHETPIQTLMKVAKSLNAEGVVYARVGSRYARSGAIARANVKLISADSGDIVASSLEESTSLFMGEADTLQTVMEEVIDEYHRFFEVLKPGFND